ncbi:MAG: phosphopantetheine-binding protein [Mycoplasmataceae bacterium]|jgi:acyl carrier protein|nr:phosphopantetheine-binding protein [Mycoplasmataceae bacterium]
MNKAEIIAILKEAAHDQNVKKNISEAELKNSLKELGIDSLQGMGIIIYMENKIGKQVADEELTKIKTGNDLVEVFHKLSK